MKPVVFFITGTSGSGKSTLVRFLKRELSSAEIHDFDEGGVPKGADESWRKQRTNEWLKKAKIYLQKGKLVVICGVSVPEEIENSPAYSKKMNVYYGYLHIGEEEIRKRLKARNWGEKLVKDNIKWARYLKKQVRMQKNHLMVNANLNNPAQVAQKFIDWILSSYS